MPVIVYVLPDGSRREVTVAAGTTIMTAAIENRVKGIIGCAVRPGRSHSGPAGLTCPPGWW